MSDIFISYARADRAMAEALANDLKARGFRVWWDAELVGSDDFYEVILQALHDAKAAIVIWSKNSAKSNFVRDEARFALHLKKLIAVKEPGLDTLDIPFGFQGQHTDDVTSREQIVRAVDKLGVKREAVTAPPTSSADVEKLKTSDQADDIVAYLGTNPTQTQRQVALERLKQLTSEGKGGDGSVRPLITGSKWQAFLSGLTFRIPKFQLSTQGIWTSVGIAVTYMSGTLFIAVYLVQQDFFIGYLFPPPPEGSPGVNDWLDNVRKGSQLGLIVLTFLIAWSAWRMVCRFSAERMILASLIIGTAYLGAVYSFVNGTTHFLLRYVFWPASEPYIGDPRFAFSNACLALAAIALALRARAAR